MARSKSPAGSKAKRANDTNIDISNDKGQAGVNAAVAASGSEVSGAKLPEKAVAAPPAAVTAAATTKSSPPTPPATPRVETKPEPKKFEVMKTDSRKNLVPINLDDEIRKRAYELYQKRGTAGSNEAEDWLTAEREVRQRYRQQRA